MQAADKLCSYIDSELGGLTTGRLYLLKGRSHLIDPLIYMAMTRNIIQSAGDAVFVDCGNSFNPYDVAAICRRIGVDEKSVLKRIIISRPFTAYQLNTLLGDGLPGVTSKSPLMVVFSKALNLFVSGDVEDRDSELILRRLLRELIDLKNSGYQLLVTHDSKIMRTANRIAEIADTILNIRDLGENKLLSNDGAQQLIDDYVEVHL